MCSTSQVFEEGGCFINMVNKTYIITIRKGNKVAFGRHFHYPSAIQQQVKARVI